MPAMPGASALLIAAALAAAALPAPAAQAAACPKASKLAFARGPHMKSGLLTWKAPRGARGLAWRVSRNGAVQGQTRATRMRIRVAPGARYRLAVRAVRSGRPAACQARKSVLVAFLAPGAPGALSASRASAGVVHLDWTKASAGDAPLAGYRLYRNGAAYGQVRTVSADVKARASADNTFEVRAADTRGNLSAPARVALARDSSASQSGPGTLPVLQPDPSLPRPEGLSATAVSDREVLLSWKPVRPVRFKLGGYRVMRDGAVIGQVQGTSFTVSNLFPSHAYSFTVAAASTSGTVSLASDAASATTLDPEASRGRAAAFLLASTGSSFADFRDHYRQIGVVHPTYFECNRSTGALQGSDDPQITAWALARAVRVMPRIDCQSTSAIHLILTNAGVRARALDWLAAICQAKGYSGVNIDFEAGAASDRAAYTSFVTALAARLHADGRQLSLAVSPKFADSKTHSRSGIFDYVALQAQADTIFVMTWGIAWATSAPGPTADLRWAAKVAGYIATMAQKQKFVMGFPLYGYDWPGDGGADERATPRDYDDVQALIAQTGAVPRYDEASAEWTFQYQSAEDGKVHTVWYHDQQSLDAHYRLAGAYGLGGFGMWRLGQEDQRVWDLAVLTPAAP